MEANPVSQDSLLGLEGAVVRRSHRIQEKWTHKKRQVEHSDGENDDGERTPVTAVKQFKTERVVIQNSPELKSRWREVKSLSGFSSDKDFMKHLLDLETTRTVQDTDRSEETKSVGHSDGNLTECRNAKSESSGTRNESIPEPKVPSLASGDEAVAETSRKVTESSGNSSVDGKVFICSDCGKFYKSYGGLYLHKKVHKGQKEFKCNHGDCGYESFYKGNLEKHIASVHEAKPVPVKRVQCSLCGKMYRKCRLEAHIRSHTGERPYCCEMCGKTFTSQHDLSCHQRNIHFVNLRYVCEHDSCGMAFQQKHQLREHDEKVHQGTRFPCPIEKCTKVFTLKRYLQKHTKTHFDLSRKYVCHWAGCSRAFRESKNLKVHLLVHTDEKPLQCPFCDFKCRQRASIKWHLKKCQQKKAGDDSADAAQEHTDCASVPDSAGISGPVCGLSLADSAQQSHTCVEDSASEDNPPETVAGRVQTQEQPISSAGSGEPTMTPSQQETVISIAGKEHVHDGVVVQGANSGSEVSLNVVHILLNMESNEHTIQIPTDDSGPMQSVDLDPSDEVVSAAATLQSIAMPSSASATMAETGTSADDTNMAETTNNATVPL